MATVSGVVTNTGNVTKTFYVGGSITSDIGGSGCGLGGTGLADFVPKTIYLAPGEQSTYSFDTATSPLESGFAPDTVGTYYLVVKVWDGPPIEGKCLDGCFVSYQLVQDVAATVTCS